MINTLWRVGLLKVKRAPEPVLPEERRPREENHHLRARVTLPLRGSAPLSSSPVRSLAPRLHKSTLSHSSDPSFVRLSSHVGQ